MPDLTEHVQGAVLDLGNARWFPVDLHVPRREYKFLLIDQEVLEHATFLDTRIPAPIDQGLTIPAKDVETRDDTAGLGWLFHTSFCCSTLLARLLHVPPHQVVLKEPLILRRLADARYSQWPIGEFVEPTVRLLARPWHSSGAVVVKPTHAALNIGVDLMAAAPLSRGLILTSSLQDFLVSNLKKSRETQAKIPALVERALRATDFHSRLPRPSLSPPSLLAAAALQWAAQREICSDMISKVGAQRMKVIDASILLDDMYRTTHVCAAWLRSPIPSDMLQDRIADVSQRNAKAVELDYGASQRAAEVRFVESKFGAQILEARRWFERFVAPAMGTESATLGLANA